MENLKKNDELVVTIERLGANGEGVATVDGKIVFVPFSLPGEKVKIHIVCDKKTFFYAKVVEVIERAKDRCNPKCDHFQKCGGCDLQHLSYDSQLLYKQNLVQKTLEKYAKIAQKPSKTQKSEKEYRYRNKFAFPVEEQNGEIVIGMYKKNSHVIVPVEDCLLQSENNKKIIKIVKNWLETYHISAYNPQTKKGIVRHIVVRENESDFILTIVVSDEKFDNFAGLIAELKNAFNVFGVYKNVKKQDNNVIFGNLDVHIYGIKELEFDEFGIKYQVNNRSFLQVNDFVKHKIYSQILNFVEGQENIIDAYSGAGLLSAIMAKSAKHVYGVEIVKEASQNAEKLKKINNLYNLININGDCAEEIPKLAKKLNGNYAIVVDPPRKGLDPKVIEAFKISEPKFIVYLSCNPATLARDLKLLEEKYIATQILPYDMFPQTANVETLVYLEKI